MNITTWTERTVVALFVCGLAAQPHISAITSAADFKPGIGWGGIGTIFGSGLADKLYQFSTTPYPTKLGNTELLLCLPGKASPQQNLDSTCAPVGLIFASPSQINFMLPASVPPQKVGFTNSTRFAIVARVGGVLDDGATWGNSTPQLPPDSFSSPQPRIFTEGYDCLIDSRFKDANQNCGLTFTKPATNAADRGAITDQAGRVLSSANPARIGQFYTIWMTGLAGFTPSNFSFWLNDVPVYGFPNANLLKVLTSYVGISPQFLGLYQVNFKMPASIVGGESFQGPAPWPCGDYRWELSTGILGYGSNSVHIPVEIKNGDVPCVKKP